VDATHSGSSHADVQAAAEGTAAAALSAHVTDLADAHDASAISVDSTSLSGTGTDVQASLEELDNLLDDHSARHEDGGADEISLAGLSGDPADTVNKSLYDANTVLAADSDNTPAALTMGASTILARLAAGSIKAASVAEINTLLGIAQAVGGVPWTVVTKASDESVASSTTLQNDDELFFTAVSGGLYDIELYLIYASPAGAGTPDFKVALGEDATTRGVAQFVSLSAADGANTNVFGMNQTGNTTAGTAAANRAIKLWGWYVGNGGTFRLLWAQGTSDVSPTILRAGSLLRYRRIV
jgi:hypothetical protein